MIPIEKNIVVVDANGNQYEATYPKRAKGLVKSGRARFIDEKTIMLRCPPNSKNELEDKNMSENMKDISSPTEVQSTPKTQPEKFTLAYCLEQIEQIRLQTKYLHNVIAELSKITTAGPGDICGSERAQALGDVVKCRETTNQKLIAFYEKMYDDLKPVRAKFTPKEELIAMLVDKLSTPGLPPDTQQSIKEILEKAMQGLYL